MFVLLYVIQFGTSAVGHCSGFQSFKTKPGLVQIPTQILAVVLIAVTGLVFAFRTQVCNGMFRKALYREFVQIEPSLPAPCLKWIGHVRRAIFIPEGIFVRDSAKNNNVSSIPINCVGGVDSHIFLREGVFNSCTGNHVLIICIKCGESLVWRLYSEIRRLRGEEDMAMRPHVYSWGFPNILEMYGNQSRLADNESAWLKFNVTDGVSHDADARTLIKLKLLFCSPQRFVRRIALLSGVMHLETGKYGVSNDGSNAKHFGCRFPGWIITIPACVGLVLGCIGWHNIRSSRRRFHGVLLFFIGIVIWIYEVFQFVKWSEHL
jgi:hypothetical protein